MPSVYSRPISGRDGAPKVEDYIPAGGDPVTLEKKRLFAQELAKDPTEPWAAARVVWPFHTKYAVYVYQTWPQDPEVMAYVEAVHNALGPQVMLPTDEEYAAHLWKLAKQAVDEDIRLKYLRLYAEARGHLKRPVGDDSGVVVNQNRVMIVTSLGSDQQWADQALDQQRALQQELADIADAATEAEVVDEAGEPESG
jgi:hypothetical protein